MLIHVVILLVVMGFVFMFLSLKSQRWWKIWMAFASAISFMVVAPNFVLIEIPAENAGGDINIVNSNLTNSDMTSVSTTPLTFEKYKDAWPLAPLFFAFGLLMLLRGMSLSVEMRKVDRDEDLEHVDLERDI